jgi:hypothetical protein
LYFDVTEAKYLDKYSLTLRFEDGSTGKVDIAPETLYEEATGTAVSFESRRMAVL